MRLRHGVLLLLPPRNLARHCSTIRSLWHALPSLFSGPRLQSSMDVRCRDHAILLGSLWPQSGCPDSLAAIVQTTGCSATQRLSASRLLPPSAFILSGTGTCGKKGSTLGDHVSRAIGEAIAAHHPWPGLVYGEARREGLGRNR